MTVPLDLIALAERPLWVCWRNEVRGGRATKVPYGAAGRKAKADDPATWLPRAQAEALAAKLVNGAGGGVGIEFAAIDDQHRLGGIDLDTCRDPASGAIEPWALEVIGRVGSYTEVSPSGGGAKIYFRWRTADLDALRQAMRTEHGRAWKRGAGEHPPAVELHLGNRYFAVTGQRLETTPSTIEPVPTETLLWLIREAGPAFSGTGSGQRKSGGTDSSRSAAAFRLAAKLRREGKTFEQMAEVLRADPETAGWCREKGEPNGGRELRRVWERAGAANWIYPTEDAVAEAFAACRAGEIVYDHTAAAWFVWQDGRWMRDTRASVFHSAREFTRAVRERLPEPPAATAKIAFSTAVEKARRADPRLAVSHETWNRDPWLLGVPGGYVDLRTGEARPGRPDLYISKQTAVAPAPAGTRAPLWDRFLDEATRHDGELRGFLKRLCGYLLTGDVSEEVMAFFYGPGENGKGVFVATITGILADYALAVPIEIFSAGSRINPEYYRAKMVSSRLVTSSETETQATWAESLIKEMTGNEAPLSARNPYGQPFEFRAEFKIVIVGNHAPRLKGRSPAMERRLRIVPFEHRPARPDPDLKERLRAEWPAIFRWMIDGCAEWKRGRLGTAPAVTAATSAYFEQQDAFRRWIEECCNLDPHLALKPGILLAAFNAWSKASGEEPVAANTFAEMIDRTQGLTRRKSNGVRLVWGIALKASGQEAA